MTVRRGRRKGVVALAAALVSGAPLWLPAAAVAPTLPILTAADVSVVEDAGQMMVVLRLDRPAVDPVHVGYSTVADTAKAPADFTRVTGTATFPRRASTVTITVPVRDDAVAEPSQHFVLSLRNARGAMLAAPSARLTLTDNDPDPGLSVENARVVEGDAGRSPVDVLITLSARSEKVITFRAVTLANTAQAHEYVHIAPLLTLPPGQTSMWLRVHAVGDTDFESRQQFKVVLRPPTNATLIDPLAFVQIVDDDELTPPPPIAPRPAFTWIGAFERQFTDAELDAVAANSTVVVIAKFHADFEIGAHHEAARRLRERNPDLRILFYVSAKYWFDANRWGVAPDEGWLLRDQQGELLRIETDRSDGSYLDLRSADLIAWSRTVFDGILSTGLYDGIAFDSVSPVGDHGEGTFWQDVLGGQAGVDAYNEGQRLLASQAREAVDTHVGPDGLVLFNGIGPGPTRGPHGTWTCSAASTERSTSSSASPRTAPSPPRSRTTSPSWRRSRRRPCS